MKSIGKELAIHSETERGIWVTWTVIVVLSSLLGDSLILIGTIKYKAIKLNKIIVAVMQHMAVCDILQTVLRVLPTTLALITDDWFLGEVLCHIHHNMGHVCNGVTLFLTCSLTTVKYLIVRYPFRARVWTARLGHKVCVAVWLLQLCLVAPTTVVDVLIGGTVYFNYWTYTCAYDISNYPTGSKWYASSGYIVFTFIPVVIMIVTSTLLLMAAKRSAARQGHGLQMSGVITVLLTVMVLIISNVPTIVALLITFIEPGFDVGGTTWGVAASIQYVNIMANFFIYALTVRSFKEFLKVKTLSLLSSLGVTIEGQRPQQAQRPPHQQAAHGQGRPAQQHQQDEDPPQQEGPLQQEGPPQRSVEGEASHVPAIELVELEREEQQHMSTIQDTSV